MNVLSDRALKHRAEQLVTLGKLEPFGVLREIAKEQEEQMRQTLLTLLNTKGTVVADVQRDVDYARGFADGMRYVTVELVAKAGRKLERIEPIEQEEIEEDRWSHG